MSIDWLLLLKEWCRGASSASGTIKQDRNLNKAGEVSTSRQDCADNSIEARVVQVLEEQGAFAAPEPTFAFTEAPPITAFREAAPLRQIGDQPGDQGYRKTQPAAVPSHGVLTMTDDTIISC